MLNLKKGDILKLETSKDVTIDAVIVKERMYESSSKYENFSVFQHLCYSQNRLFLIEERYYPEDWMYDDETGVEILIPSKCEYAMGEVLVEYCILPEYDSIFDLLEAESFDWDKFAEEQDSEGADFDIDARRS